MTQMTALRIAVAGLALAGVAACATAPPSGRTPMTLGAATLPDVGPAVDDQAATLMALAIGYHRAGQALDEAGLDFRPVYRTASRYYGLLLARHPNHPRRVRLHFYYAELLFELHEHDAAVDHYEVVLAEEPDATYVEDAALGAMFAFEDMLGTSCSGRPRYVPESVPFIRYPRILR